jgi:SAM-dependent methyltransferase
MTKARSGHENAQKHASADLYNTSYGNYGNTIMGAIRSETYGEDLGQSGWMTADELRQFIRWLKLKPSFHVLEVGSGSGGSALFVARTVGCRLTGIDINQSGIRNANDLALRAKLKGLVHFRKANAGRALPFADGTFDALISNDAMCHIPGRSKVLKDWFRVLKPGGRMIFTDAMVITGLVSHQEIAARSSIGNYFFLPQGENERLICAAGFKLLRADDLTAACAAIAERWHDARARRSVELSRIEGEENFQGLQKFLWCVRTLTFERRLSRFSYLGLKPNERGKS